VDWLHGYPFEFAKPGDVFSFLRSRGFDLNALTARSHPMMANDEYVFCKTSSVDSPPSPVEPQVTTA
jgi:2-polyprenyl-6-hydroxyphenyl methylase/3-demethylubiquinone-9 3-methyltransferase